MSTLPHKALGALGEARVFIIHTAWLYSPQLFPKLVERDYLAPRHSRDLR